MNNDIDAFASYTIHNTTSKGRPCLKGVVEVETNNKWFAFTVFGFTAEEIQNAAYMQADLAARQRGWKLQALRRM